MYWLFVSSNLLQGVFVQRHCFQFSATHCNYVYVYKVRQGRGFCWRSYSAELLHSVCERIDIIACPSQYKNLGWKGSSGGWIHCRCKFLLHANLTMKIFCIGLYESSFTLVAQHWCLQLIGAFLCGCVILASTLWQCFKDDWKISLGILRLACLACDSAVPGRPDVRPCNSKEIK